jgi:hypothetical protein
MQQLINDQCEAVNRLTGELTQTANEFSQSAFSVWSQNPWSLTPWAHLTKSLLVTAKSAQELNAEAFNKALRQPARVQELDTLATSLRDASGIVSEFANAVTQLNIDTLNSFTAVCADNLTALKEAASLDDLIATQLHVQTEYHEKLKDNAAATIKTLNALQSAWFTWGENSLDKIAEETPAEKPMQPPVPKLDKPPARVKSDANA